MRVVPHMSVIRIRDLSRFYTSPDGERREVVRVSAFALDEKEEVALEGASGSGKTTFLNLIAGILAADSGSVLIENQEMVGVPEAQRDAIRAHAIGYVFQTFNLLQGYSALENVLLAMAFGRGPDPAWARQLLERVGLAKRLDYRPAHLSVGQQQRVALARALANRPRVVLADEPTANLDARNAEDAILLLREIARESGASLLLVSHDPAVLSQFTGVRRMADVNAAAASPR